MIPNIYGILHGTIIAGYHHPYADYAAYIRLNKKSYI